MSKKEFILSLDEKTPTFKFTFEIENDNSMIISASEIIKDKVLPKIYKSTFTKDELTEFNKTGISIKSINRILEEISSSFGSKKATFNFNDTELTLHYLLFKSDEVSVKIPSLKIDASDEIINKISKKLLSLNDLSNGYGKLIKRFSNNFSKNKNTLHDLHKKNHQLKKQADISEILLQQQSDIIEKLSSIQTYIQENESKKTQTLTRLEVCKEIYSKNKIHDMCFLRDGRLVTGGQDGKVTIYEGQDYESSITINNEYPVNSVCGLKNWNLAFGGEDNLIKIYEINGNIPKFIQALEGHTFIINKIIELEDGKLCSCSSDKTVMIWDNNNNYQCAATLNGHNDFVKSIIEINNYIVSSSPSATIEDEDIEKDSDDNSLCIWNKSTYEQVKGIKEIFCNSEKGLAKLNNDTIILGGTNEIYILEILSFKYKSFKDSQLGYIESILVLKEDQLLIGNKNGWIYFFNPLSNQVIFTQRLHREPVLCIIKGKDDKIFSSSESEIKVYS